MGLLFNIQRHGHQRQFWIPDGRGFFQGPACPWRAFCRCPMRPSQNETWWELTNGAQEP